MVGGPPTQSLSLPGAVSVDIPATGPSTWAYSSLQGHTLATGDGTSTAGIRLHDPFGQPLTPDTLSLGTASADDAGMLNETSTWHHGAEKIAESAGSTLVIEMGERT